MVSATLGSFYIQFSSRMDWRHYCHHNTAWFVAVAAHMFVGLVGHHSMAELAVAVVARNYSYYLLDRFAGHKIVENKLLRGQPLRPNRHWLRLSQEHLKRYLPLRQGGLHGPAIPFAVIMRSRWLRITLLRIASPSQSSSAISVSSRTIVA